jgi:hypothetical protein
MEKVRTDNERHERHERHRSVAAMIYDLLRVGDNVTSGKLNFVCKKSNSMCDCFM